MIITSYKESWEMLKRQMLKDAREAIAKGGPQVFAREVIRVHEGGTPKSWDALLREWAVVARAKKK
jgi:hypothetical protein